MDQTDTILDNVQDRKDMTRDIRYPTEIKAQSIQRVLSKVSQVNPRTEEKSQPRKTEHFVNKIKGRFSAKSVS
jgi:hypothetical protein